MVRVSPVRSFAIEGLIGRFLIVCMGIGFVALIVAGGVAVWAFAANEQHAGWVQHTYKVEIALADYGRLIEQGETARRGYILTSDPSYFATFDTAQGAARAARDRLAALTIDNSRQRANIVTLDREVASLARNRADTNALVSAGQADAAIAHFRAQAGTRRLKIIRDRLAVMGSEERRLLGLRDAEQRHSLNLFYLVLVITGALVLLVAITSFATIRRYTTDLGQSRDALRGLNDSLEDQVAERTADLSRANEEIQRFAYIVSHDLRSPLVNVMGFTAELSTATKSIAELIDRVEESAPEIVTDEARIAVREDLPEAIGFIRTSTQKMDRLINAILKLSREGRRVITAEPLDLAGIVEGIGASMQHRIDERGVELIVDRPLPALVSDRLAIEQILSNLIENAVKYLAPDRPGVITVSGMTERSRVILTVADNGRGIDPRDHARVFDLFRRSGTQDQPGEGIGLAHVRALAYRLGGTIDVESTLGEGATFRLSFPPTLTELQDEKR